MVKPSTAFDYRANSEDRLSPRCGPCMDIRRAEKASRPSEPEQTGPLVFAASLKPRYLSVTDRATIELDLGQFLPAGATPTDVTLRLDDLDPVLEPAYSELFLDRSPEVTGTVLTQPIDGEVKPRMAVLLTVTGSCSTGARFMATVTFVTTE